MEMSFISRKITYLLTGSLELKFYILKRLKALRKQRLLVAADGSIRRLNIEYYPQYSSEKEAFF